MPIVPPQDLSFQQPGGELHITSVDSSGNSAAMVDCPGQENQVSYFLRSRYRSLADMLALRRCRTAPTRPRCWMPPWTTTSDRTLTASPSAMPPVRRNLIKNAQDPRLLGHSFEQKRTLVTGGYGSSRTLQGSLCM